MKFGKIYIDRNIVLAGAVYFLVCGMILFKFGIQLNGEAEKYTDCANRILQGKGLRNGFFGILYVFYSVIVAIFIKSSIHLAGVAILQVGLSYFAALCLYKLLIETLENRTVAFLFFVAYLLCYPLQKWNFFLYTEGMHTSLVVIAVYFFHKVVTRETTGRWIVFGLMILAVIFSRPVGMIFFFAALLTFTVRLFKQKRRVGAIFVAATGIACIIGILNSPVISFINPDSLKRMEIICQVPEANAGIVYQEVNPAGLGTAYRVIRDEIGFGKFIKIGGKKLAYFFGMVRPYYSRQNNGLLILYWLFYPLALLGIFSKTSSHFDHLRMLSVVYLIFISLTIIFTCDDWANRFIAPAFPFILIPAAAGFQRLSGGLNFFRKKKE